MSDSYNATCIAREEINPALFVVRVRSDDGPTDFRAGQYATLGLLTEEPRLPTAEPDPKPRKPNTILKRPYSIASGPHQREFLEFIVTYVPEGEYSPRLCNLAIGDRLWMAPRVKGTFTFDLVRPDKNVVLVATGTGIAPFVSFVRSHFEPSDKRQWVVLHGARYSWDLGYRGEFETVDRLCSNFTYIPSITRPAEDPFFLGPVGRVPALLEQEVVESCAGVGLDPNETDVFLCGNPDMIQGVTEFLEARGFEEDRPRDPKSIHTEKYW